MTSKRGHSYNFVMQKYLLLLEQHQEVATHLEQIRPRKTSITSTSTRSSSVSSATSTSPKRTSRDRRHGRRARGGGFDSAYQTTDPLDTILDEETLYVISAEEQRLFDVNEGIKRALMELLNCDTVRGDASMRSWAQGRLLETEKELRSGRRRLSSATVD